jgi:hypothetical protein
MRTGFLHVPVVRVRRLLLDRLGVEDGAKRLAALVDAAADRMVRQDDGLRERRARARLGVFVARVERDQQERGAVLRDDAQRAHVTDGIRHAARDSAEEPLEIVRRRRKFVRGFREHLQSFRRCRRLPRARREPVEHLVQREASRVVRSAVARQRSRHHRE